MCIHAERERELRHPWCRLASQGSRTTGAMIKCLNKVVSKYKLKHVRHMRKLQSESIFPPSAFEFAGSLSGYDNGWIRSDLT